MSRLFIGKTKWGREDTNNSYKYERMPNCSFSWQSSRERDTLVQCWWECKMVQSLLRMGLAAGLDIGRAQR